MVLKPEVIPARLSRLEEVISRLEQIGPIDAAALVRDFRDAWVAEGGLELAAEIILDIGNHILSAHFGVSAENYEAIIALLGAQGVIPERLWERLRGLGGFRNILVRGYLRIDPSQVADALAAAPRDFSSFAEAIRGWLAQAAPPGAGGG